MSLEGPWAPIGNGPRVRVVLLNFMGVVRHSWEATLERFDDRIVILKAVATKKLPFEEATINPGDRVVQYFPRNEWYYIQEYRTPSGQLKGWYCNIAAPPKVEESTITTQDMILDLFVSPDLIYKILDAEELEEHKTSFPTSTVDKIHRAREKLIRIVERREFPFDRQNTPC